MGLGCSPGIPPWNPGRGVRQAWLSTPAPGSGIFVGVQLELYSERGSWKFFAGWDSCRLQEANVHQHRADQFTQVKEIRQADFDE